MYFNERFVEFIFNCLEFGSSVRRGRRTKKKWQSLHEDRPVIINQKLKGNQIRTSIVISHNHFIRISLRYFEYIVDLTALSATITDIVNLSGSKLPMRSAGCYYSFYERGKSESWPGRGEGQQGGGNGNRGKTRKLSVYKIQLTVCYCGCKAAPWSESRGCSVLIAS